MSTPVHRPYQSAATSLQQGTWERDPDLREPSHPARASHPDEAWIEEDGAKLVPTDLDRLEREIGELDRLEQDIAMEHRRIRRKLAAEFAPPPPYRPATRGGFGFVSRIALVVVLATAGAWFAAGKLPFPTLSNASNAEAPPPIQLASLGKGPDAAPAPIKAPAVTPQLVAEGARAQGDLIPVGVKVSGPAENAVAVINGLVPGTTLSKGRAWGATSWIVPAAELGATTIRRPQGFVGTMEYTVVLHLSDNTIVDQQSMRLEWSDVAAVPDNTNRTPLNNDEVGLLLKRGQELLETGDISSARLLLRRAADARNARAAFGLAATYDPLVLQELGVYGFAPDVAMARHWYEKAREYGSKEAPQRLELLASQSR